MGQHPACSGWTGSSREAWGGPLSGLQSGRQSPVSRLQAKALMLLCKGHRMPASGAAVGMGTVYRRDPHWTVNGLSLLPGPTSPAFWSWLSLGFSGPQFLWQ